MQRCRLPPDSELRAGAEPWPRAWRPPHRAARAAGACTAASSSGERPAPSRWPGFEVWAGGRGGGWRSGPLEWKRWGQKEGGVAPSAAAPNTSDQCQVRRGAMARALGPDKRSKRTAAHTQDWRLLMLAHRSRGRTGLDTHAHAHAPSKGLLVGSQQQWAV